MSTEHKSFYVEERKHTLVVDVSILRPTAKSFIKFYIESALPLILFALAYTAKSGVPVLTQVYYLFFIIFVFAVAWVLRSRFAQASLGLFIALLILFSAYYIYTSSPSIIALPVSFKTLLEEKLQQYLAASAAVSSAIVLLYAEVFRRSIVYEVGTGGVTIAGGVVRRQEVFYPYTQIANAVVERGLLARLLGYGTVILVSTGGWGAEQYTRGIGGGGTAGAVAGGVFYARTLTEVSRDPLKCLYGIPEPEKVAGEIKSKLSFTYEALERQVKLLEKIAKNTERESQESR